MNYIEECLEKFNKLPQELQDFLNSEKVLKTLDEIEQNYGVDLTLALVLVFINELELEGLSFYIKEKYKTDNETTNKILIKLEDNIFQEIYNSFNNDYDDVVLERDYVLDLSYEEKKSLISSIFLEKILEQFQLPEEHLFRLNAVTFELIGRDEQFLNKLIKNFLNNKELISSRKLIIKNKKEDPSISNWVNDFVINHGSDIFSSLTLAKYLTSSENAMILNSEEKQILRQILKIYRNLVFFPESMGFSKYSDWEIFPINKDLLSFYQNKKNSDSKKQKIKKEISDKQEDDIETKEEKIEEKKEEKIEEKKEEKTEEKIDLKLLNAELEKIEKNESKHSLEKQELEVLQEMLEKYPQNSLERKAIQSEIKKRNK